MDTELHSILPIDGRVFNTSQGAWTARVMTWPIPPQDGTLLLYELEFQGPSVRRLRLWIPGEVIVENRQQEALDDVQRWLEEPDGDGELRSCFS